MDTTPPPVTYKSLSDYLPYDEVTDILTHGNCLDGAACAQFISNANPDRGVDVHYLMRGKPIPDMHGKHVAMVDYCGTAEEMEKLKRECARLIVIDHHVIDPTIIESVGHVFVDTNRIHAACFHVCEYIRAKQPRAAKFLPIHEIIEQHDLFTFNFETKKIISLMKRFPKTIESVCTLINLDYYMSNYNWFTERINRIATAIEKNDKALIEQAARTAVKIKNGDRSFAIVNCTQYDIISEVAVKAAIEVEADVGIALNFDFMADVISGSIRLGPTGKITNLQPIARLLGGGGSATTAGFRFRGSFTQFIEALSSMELPENVCPGNVRVLYGDTDSMIITTKDS